MPLLPPADPVRFVTSAGAVDRNDSVIYDIGRELRSQGAEVIYLGCNRTIETMATIARTEGVHGVALCSWRGDSIKIFTRLRALLNTGGAGHVQVFGIGGTVAPVEILVLKRRGVTIFGHQDGQYHDLATTAEKLIQACAVDRAARPSTPQYLTSVGRAIGRQTI
jgi:methylmalonyl-CoA mutase